MEDAMDRTPDLAAREKVAREVADALAALVRDARRPGSCALSGGARAGDLRACREPFPSTRTPQRGRSRPFGTRRERQEPHLA